MALVALERQSTLEGVGVRHINSPINSLCRKQFVLVLAMAASELRPVKANGGLALGAFCGTATVKGETLR